MSPFAGRVTGLGVLLGMVISAVLGARDLTVDRRGGAEFDSLKAAADLSVAGDTIVIARGSGPYRETLRIPASGAPGRPITVEGNGETITGFAPLTGFRREGDVWTCRLPAPFPLVIAFRGQRILQAQDHGRLLGPARLQEDNQTLVLAPGTPVDGWEVSTLTNAVQVHGVSHHVYRNIVATGALNDGFNLHGNGTDLVFEKITAAQNLDEGFSAHGTIECEIRGGDFWGNDNGLGNVGRSRLRATGIRLHGNLGWGLWLGGQAWADLSDLRAWNNGVAQIRFDREASGRCREVRVWPVPAATRPWIAYREAAVRTLAEPLVNAAASPDPAKWDGRPELSVLPSPSSGVSAGPAR